MPLNSRSLVILYVSIFLELSAVSATYLGCFKDDYNARDLPKLLELTELSSKGCREICSAQRYRYCGLQHGTHCYCGDSYGRHGSVPETNCQERRCLYSNEWCGGAFRNRVFETGYQPQSARSARLLGCFMDYVHSRDLPFFINKDTESVAGHMRKELCFLACKSHGYKYFGIQYGRECFCGNTYGRYGLRPMSECNNHCLGNWQELCGNQNRNSIYQINP